MTLFNPLEDEPMSERRSLYASSLTPEQFKAFMDWQMEQPDTRHFKIEVEGKSIKIYVSDSELMEGQFVHDASEIDLIAAKRKTIEQRHKLDLEILARHEARQSKEETTNEAQ